MSDEIELTVKGTPEAIGRLLNPLRAEYVPPSISVPAIALEDIDGPDLPVMNAKPKSDGMGDLADRWRHHRVSKGLYELTTSDGTKIIVTTQARDGSLVDGEFYIVWRQA